MTGRIVGWFSCGAASAVAAHLLLKRYDRERVRLVYTDTGSEHPDSKRFMADCEEWLGHRIETIRSERHADIWSVFEKERFLVGPDGARCTAELKKKPRYAFQHPLDLQAFGYTIDETDRAARFREQNPDVRLLTPLIEAGLSKADCLATLRRVGIELPAMYRLGYRNNNCIGCVKGGMGYWNKIRVDFPETFQRMARIERELGHAINKDKGGAVYLDELAPGRGRYAEEADVECSLLCYSASEAA